MAVSLSSYYKMKPIFFEVFFMIKILRKNQIFRLLVKVAMITWET